MRHLMESALDNIRFLSRSHHRVSVLRSLLQESHDRAGLRKKTGASSSTLGRILGDFTDRGWVVRSGHRYETTPMGDLIGREFVRVLESMETVEQLHDAVAWLPSEGMDFDLSCLQNAEVVTAAGGNPFMPIITLSGRLGAATEVRAIASVAIPQPLAVIREAVTNETQTVQMVATTSFFDAIESDPEMQSSVREIAATDRSEVCRYEDDFPYNLAITDDKLLMTVTDGGQMPRALIISDNEEVVSWAVSTYDSYRTQAEPLDPTFRAS